MICKNLHTFQLKILISTQLKNKRAMSKFLLTGVLLVLLASFLHYSPASTSNTTTSVPQRSEMMLYNVGERIQLTREQRRISQKELANKVGLTKFDIDKIENGRVVPTAELLVKIEEVLNTSLSMN